MPSTLGAEADSFRVYSDKLITLVEKNPYTIYINRYRYRYLKMRMRIDNLIAKEQSRQGKVRRGRAGHAVDRSIDKQLVVF